MNIKKVAAEDATRYAYARMFFGAGAGTRRKLLNAEIAHKVENISGYHEAFEAALAKQDLAKLAQKAMKERKAIDRAAKLQRNTRALIRGDIRGLTTGVFVVAGVGYVLHQTGHDKVILAETKKQYKKGRAWLDMQWKLHKARQEHNHRLRTDPEEKH